MIETHVRIKVQPFFNFIGSLLIRYRSISPNVITGCALITGIISGILIATEHLLYALIFLLISGLCDVLDGTVARLSHQSQKIGAYFDLISDRMVEAAVIVGFAVYAPQHLLAYLFFFVSVLLHFSTFVIASSLWSNTGEKSLHYDKSIVERAEAFIIFVLMLLFPAYLAPLLVGLNCAIFIAAGARFIRVVRYAQSFEN